jgi:predicted GNAT family N-acyltransferase
LESIWSADQVLFCSGKGAAAMDMIPADSDDILQRCLGIRNTVFVNEKKVSADIERDSSDSIGPGCDHWLIRDGSRDVGTLRCLYCPKEIIKVQRFCILSEYRGHGFGKQALAYLESHYRERGFKRMELDSKYAVHHFYEKCGFLKVSEVFIEAGVEHVRMIKEL